MDDRITHLFCPSSSEELPTSCLHSQPSQSCAWTINGQYFCTSGYPVRILDFRPSPLAACAVPTGEFARVTPVTMQSSTWSSHKSAGGLQMTLVAALRMGLQVAPPLQLQFQRVLALWMCVPKQTVSLPVQVLGVCCCSASRERHELVECLPTLLFLFLMYISKNLNRNVWHQVAPLLATQCC